MNNWIKKTISNLFGLAAQANQGWRTIFSGRGSSQRKELDVTTREQQLAFHAVFVCVSLISADVGKLPLRLQKREDGVWVDQVSHPLIKLLSRPNSYQNLQQFLSYWAICLLTRGNVYAIKVKDIFSGKALGLKILNPDLVDVLITDTGEVFYRIAADRLNTTEPLILSSDEIIHDRINPLYHPLVGLSPMIASEASVTQGIAIRDNSSNFFSNQAVPSGVLKSPNRLDETQSKQIRDQWTASYGGRGNGRIAVLGEGAEFKPVTMSAVDAQVIEQYKMTAEIVCNVFRVPAFKAGFGSLPQGLKVTDINEIYYSSCLQPIFSSVEQLLSEFLGLSSDERLQFDEEELIRMDPKTRMEITAMGIKGSVFTPNNGRNRHNLKSLPGGDSIYMQQQNYSLEALSKRDAPKANIDEATDA